MHLAGLIDFMTDCGLLIGLHGKTSEDLGKGENKQHLTLIISLSFLNSGVFVNLYFNQCVENKIDKKISNWDTGRI